MEAFKLTPVYSESAVSSSFIVRCCFLNGCLRRDTFVVVVVVGGFSKSFNCLSVNCPLYQSALQKRKKKKRKIQIFYLSLQWKRFLFVFHEFVVLLFSSSSIMIYHSGIFRAQSHRLETSSNAWPNLQPFLLGCSPLTHT